MKKYIIPIFQQIESEFGYTILYIEYNFNLTNMTNFSKIDSNKDGVITADEMTNLTNKLATTGMTKTEIQQLYASGSSGISESKMSEIMEHFEDMDTNGDGKLTDAEISAYSVTSAKQQKELAL